MLFGGNIPLFLSQAFDEKAERKWESESNLGYELVCASYIHVIMDGELVVDLSPCSVGGNEHKKRKIYFGMNLCRVAAA